MARGIFINAAFTAKASPGHGFGHARPFRGKTLRDGSAANSSSSQVALIQAALDKTFGKGLIQTLINLGDTSGLAVTVARYLTPSGRDIQNQGIEPNTPLAEPEPLNPGSRDDTWLMQAEDLLLLQLDPTPAPEAA